VIGQLPTESIAAAILVLRGQKVILDADLAALYGIATKALNQAVKRNSKRFPADFMFRLDSAEIQLLNRSQFVTGSRKHRDPRFAPFAFTEHGAVMAASLINSEHAIEMSIYVVRTFVKLRQLLATNADLAARLKELETHVTQQFGTYDQTLTGILKTLRELMNPPVTKRRAIGFTADLD
jgi:hypothetical protein